MKHWTGEEGLIGMVLFRLDVRRPGAVTRDVTFGSACVAGLALRLRAVLGNVTCSGAVIALGTLHTVAGYMAYASASEASLLVASSEGAVASTTSTVTSIAATTATTTTTSSSAAAAISSSTGAGAVTRDMAYLAAAVAFRRAASSSTSTGIASASTIITTGIGAIPRNVTLLPALVAGLGLGFAGAIAGDVTLLSTVIASGRTRLRAGSSLVTEAATVKASTSSRHSFSSN